MKKFVLRRAIAVAKKEVFHILRDPFTLLSALGLPVFMVIIFGVAIEFNVRDIKLSINDSDQSQASRRLLDTFSSSHYFINSSVASPTEAIQNLTSEEARAALIIPLNFEKNLGAGRQARTQILLDGSDSSTVAPVLSYIGNIQKIANERITNLITPNQYEIRTRYLFNPELNSRWFIIPGLNVLVMAILSILLTALTVAREYENGSMELLLTTPIQPLEIILGKLAPYGVLGIMAIAFIYLIARSIFEVPFVGSHIIFLLGAIIFLIAYLGQGLLISVTTRNQQIAMQLAMITGMLPTQMLSGFIFPIESMPQPIQYFTMIFPSRWFMIVSRNTFLEGSGFFDLAIPFMGLIIFCFFVILMGTKRFKRDLEA